MTITKKEIDTKAQSTGSALVSNRKTLNNSPSSDLHVISLHKQIHVEVVRQSW